MCKDKGNLICKEMNSFRFQPCFPRSDKPGRAEEKGTNKLGIFVSLCVLLD
jgi:hypothetical protein